MASTKPNFTAISLFSGAGGDTLGLKNAGVNVIAYNEYDPKFCKTHEANFPNCTLIQNDNTSDIREISDETFLKYKDKVDIIFAGFPCQGFSKAGKKKDNDPRNTMFKEFVRAATLMNPYMVIGENVKGLLKKKTNNGENFIDIICNEFINLGYDVSYQVMKCDHYDVPQKRERLIIIGIRTNPYGWTVKFPTKLTSKPNLKNIIQYSMIGAVKVSEVMFNFIPTKSIITNMNDTTLYLDNNKGHPYLVAKLNPTDEQRSYKTTKKIKTNGYIKTFILPHETKYIDYDKNDNIIQELPDKTIIKETPYLFSFNKRESPIHCEIININTPCKTIICTYNNQPRFFVPIKNASGCYLRTLLPDELKQIQGFPADYIICGSVKDQIIQIGNAVPPPLITHIVKNIILQ